MKKKSRTQKVPIDKVYLDPIYQRVAQFVQAPDFFSKAIAEYGHHTNLPVCQRDDKYYLLGFKSTIDSLILLGSEEVLVDIIDISDKETIKFFLNYQCQEHLGERCIAEVVKICQEFTAKPESKDWLRTITGARDKQKQYSILLGISEYAAKCYLKVAQKGNEKFLELLLDKKRGLSKAYEECCNAEKKPRQCTSDGGSDNADGNASGQAKAQDQNDEAHAGGSSESGPLRDAGRATRSAKGIARAVPKSEDAHTPDNNIFLEQLEKYKKQDVSSGQAESDFATKVVVFLTDGSQLGINGKMDLIVNGLAIRSHDLRKNQNGTWMLPEYREPISLIIYPENNTSDEMAQAA